MTYIGISCEAILERDEENDHEARTEAKILRRDSMRHIGDWFYPDGGWGWCVLFIACVLNIVSMGPVMSGSQVMTLSIQKRTEKESPHSMTPILISVCGFYSSKLFFPFVLPFCQFKSPRLAGVVGGLILSLGWLFISFATRIHQIAITYSLFVGKTYN